MSITIEEKLEIRGKAAKPMLWLAIVSMVMIFAGLTSAYVVRQAKGDWQNFDLPIKFYISTSLILLSSITMNWALISAKKNNLKNVKQALVVTLALGVAFVVFQFLGWGDLVKQQIFFAGKLSNASGSFLYIITGVHLAHLLAGLISLVVTLFMAVKEKYNPDNLLGLHLCSIYWHFLAILWVYLFLFLLFIH